MRRILFLIIIVGIFLVTGCSKQLPPSTDQVVNDAGTTNQLQLQCAVSYSAEIGKPFTVTISAPHPDSSPGATVTTPVAGNASSANPNIESIHVNMGADTTVKYEPVSLDLRPGMGAKTVTVTFQKASASGLSFVRAYPDGAYRGCESVVDTGFQGHLQILNNDALQFGESLTTEIGLLDQSNKPLNLGLDSLKVELQSEDAALAKDRAPNSALYDSIPLLLAPGASSTPQFRISPLGRYGKPIHLSATLKTGDGTVLTQSTFNLTSDPVWWLPILLAITGATLYTSYRISQQDDVLTREVFFKGLITSILAGTVAWMFADFDLLGLKLDPHILRTYPILGFLFSYVGIDVLLKKSFSSNGRIGNPPPPPPQPETVHH